MLTKRSDQNPEQLLVEAMGTIREAIEMVESKEGDLTDFSFLTTMLEQMSDEVSD